MTLSNGKNTVIRPRYIDTLSKTEQTYATKYVIKPSVRSGNVPIHIDFSYNYRKYVNDVYIPVCYYDGAKNANHIITYSPDYVSEEKATQLAYESMILEKNQEFFYKKLLSYFYDIRLKYKLSIDSYLELLVSYVQSLPYDNKKANSNDLHVRFPIETAVEGIGICSDKSLLLAGLLTCSGYAVSLLSFETAKHMLVGIPAVNSGGTMDTGYHFIETTSSKVIGLTPNIERVSGNIAYTHPEIYKIGYGRLVYSKSNSVRIVQNLKNYLDNELNSSNITNSFFLTQSKIDRYNEMVELYNGIESGSFTVDEIMKKIRLSPNPKIRSFYKT